MDSRKDKLLQDVDYYLEKLDCGCRYEEQWKKIKSQYSSIYIYKLDNQAIGETLPRAINMIKDFRLLEDNARLNVVIPVMKYSQKGDVFNYRLLEVLSRYLYIVKLDNIYLWKYILENHYDELICSEYSKYRFRKVCNYDLKYGNSMFEFSDLEKRELVEKKIKMKLNGSFVCIHARGSEGKKLYTDIDNWENRDVARNCNIDSFEKAALYLQENHIQLIRMGKYETSECNLTNCIDYANEYYDSLMDLYLLKECKFLIGCQSGLTHMVEYFGKTALITNVLFLHFDYSSLPRTEHDVLIFKKIWSKQKERFLNIYEMMAITELCQDDIVEYQKRGLEIIDNTPQEICDAVIEVNQRVNGLWKEDEANLQRQKRYSSILDAWKERHKIIHEMNPNRDGYMGAYYRIGAKFLYENEGLLNCEECIY